MNGPWTLASAQAHEVDMSAEQLARIDAHLQNCVDSHMTPGVIAVIARKGKVVFDGKYGYANAVTKTPMQWDTLFRIYSMTKPISGVLIMRLLEEGRLLLDDPIERFLPAMKKLQVRYLDGDGHVRLRDPKRKVTIHDLLTHTSGFSYDLMRTARSEGWNHDEFIERFAEVPMLGDPGEKWRYSSANDVLGILAEKVTDMPLTDLLHDRIFEPLNMTETRFSVSEKDLPRLAEFHGRENDEWVRREGLNAQEIFNEGQGFLSMGGGLISTTSDYLNFSQMLVNNGTFNDHRIISRSSVEAMRACHLPAGHKPLAINGRGYGLTVETVRSHAENKEPAAEGEFGWGGAAATQIWIDPVHEALYLIMQQLAPNATPPLLEHEGRRVMQTFRAMGVAAVL